jgi:hypothetical protein
VTFGGFCLQRHLYDKSPTLIFLSRVSVDRKLEKKQRQQQQQEINEWHLQGGKLFSFCCVCCYFYPQ